MGGGKQVKKKLVGTFLIIVILLLSINTVAMGASEIPVYYNGERIVFDVNPIMVGGRTMVPMRAIFETFGATVDYDQGSNQITGTKGSREIKLRVGNTNATVANSGIVTPYILDVPPMIRDGRTLVPLRFIGQALGASVNWDDKTRTVTISTQDSKQSAIDHVILSVVYVTTDWSPFTDISGWPGNVPIKESQGVKFYEATIWDDTLSIHLYALPNDYNQLYGDHENLSTAEKVAYRESYLVKKFSGMPTKNSERGPFVLNAFTEFARILVEKHPDASHNLIFNGHGGAGGELFTLHLNHSEANRFLGNWHSMLGRKLGFIDMGGPCNKGSFYDLLAFYEHADYYIASDLDVCGYLPDDPDDPAAEYNRTHKEYNYPRILSSHKNLRDALIERVNLRRRKYELARNNITGERAMQSMYLYSCSAFGRHKDAISSFMKSQDMEGEGYFVDIRSTMIKKGAAPELLKAFDSIIIHGVDTKDFFRWPEEKNGMIWLPYF
jgi:hypothetical protein